MFNKQYIKTYVFCGLLAAIAFAIPVLFYLRTPQFIDTWMLFTGNALFFAVVAVFILFFNKKNHENASTQNMNAAGHIVTLIGVVISCILSFIMLLLFVPDIFAPGSSETVVENAPVSSRGGKTDGLVFMLFMNAVVGNFAAGSIASITLPYTAKRNQTKDKHSDVLEN